jgi:hypothetical protein
MEDIPDNQVDCAIACVAEVYEGEEGASTDLALE